jgi:hypothetical protein
MNRRFVHEARKTDLAFGGPTGRESARPLPVGG